MMGIEVGLSLGTNTGDRLEHLADAKRHLLEIPGVREVACSSVYETEPMGVKPEYEKLKFLNAVLVVMGELGPEQWLHETDRIELAMGRRRTEDRNAPRPIDIDILYAGDFMIHEPGLILPHPRWAEREFVLQPLAEVRPDLVLPGTGNTVTSLLEPIKGTCGVQMFCAEW